MNVPTLLKSRRFWTLIAAIVAALTAFFCMESCSRSTLLFKGSGDIEYYFKGTNGPNLERDDR